MTFGKRFCQALGVIALGALVSTNAIGQVTTRLVTAGGSATSTTIAPGGTASIDVRIDAPATPTIGTVFRLSQTAPVANGFFSITARSFVGSPYNDAASGTADAVVLAPISALLDPDNNDNLGRGTIGLVATPGANNILVAKLTLTASGATPLGTYTIKPTAGVSFVTGDGPTFTDYDMSGATYTIIVGPALVAPPMIAKSFGAASIPLNGSTSLSFTINNPNASSTLTGVGFIDTLPAGLVVSTPNGLTGSCSGGTITAVAGSSSVSLTGATLAPTASCTFSVNVTANTLGTKNNTTSTVTSVEGGAGGTASASVTVVAVGLNVVFKPLEPCRIMDTRSATAGSGMQGPIAGNSLYTVPGFVTAGQNWSQYGGSATDCGLTNPPGTSIRAVALVATILNPNFDAYLGIGDTPSLSSVLSNVALNFTSGQGLSTMYIVPQLATNNIYFAMPAGLSAQVIFDVVGFHVLNDATALECTTQASAPVSIGIGASGTATSPACGAGYTLSSGSCDSTSFTLNLTQNKASGGNTTWLCAATNRVGGAANLTATANCCRVPGK